jgi:catechol 2,3-dioxygenase-like lactoylglutathione lyase family enzyme
MTERYNKLILQLAHVCFGCRDLKKSIAFYHSMFNFEVVHEYRNDVDELYGVFLGCGRNTFLELFKEQDDPGRGGLFRHICFEVEDLNPLIAKFSENNIEFEQKRSRSDATLQAFIFDPDGNKIEFHHYDKKSSLWPHLDIKRTIV